MWAVSLTHPFLASFFNLGSFSYTSCADFLFMWGVSLTHPMLTLFLCGEFLLHIPCWLHFYLGSFSYTSRAVFIFCWGVSLTHPMLTFFIFYVVSFSYTSRAVLMSMQGVSLTHPVLKLSVRKRLCQFLRKEAVKTGRPKNKPELKKLISERIRAQQTAQMTTPQKKSWMEDGSGNQREKVTLRGEKGALHKRKQSY